ncbi:hypothetical protein CL633_00225 [bacterium]|nr:hypothetical protein [bacterium]
MIKKAIKIIKKYGLKAFVRESIKWILTKLHLRKPEASVRSSQYNYIDNFLRLKQHGKYELKQALNLNHLTINWIIPDLSRGAGGHMTIFRIAKFLEEFGHKNRIYVFNGCQHKNLEKFINKNFIKFKNTEFYTNIDSVRDSDVLFATSWQTAYPVKVINNTRRKFYFVQDFEPWFYPMSAEYKFAENTYKFGFHCITAGSWLAKIMQEKYNAKSNYFDLAYDRQIYYPKNKNKNNKQMPLIAYYARPSTSRRGFELAMQSFRELFRRGIDFKVILFGWDESQPGLPFPCKSMGILEHGQLASLYNKVDLGLVFSLTNYSLIPQEMMACKLPVVDINSETTQAIFTNNKNIILADPNPIAVANAMEKLLKHNKLRDKIAENGHNWVGQFSWKKSAKKVEDIIKAELISIL